MTKVFALCLAAVLVAGSFSLIGCASEKCTATKTQSTTVVQDPKQYH